MSTGSTIMLQVPAATSWAAAGGDDDVECRACYGVVAACVSLLLFCVVAATAGVVKACAVAGLAVVFFGIVGWLVSAGARRADDAAGASALRLAGCACRLVGVAAADVPPAFAYECPGDADGKPGGSTLCAVCLEDVQRGEAVRRLPACGHLFHVECIDMWLRSHTTCPLCRCDLLPPTCTGKSATAAVVAAAAQSSSSDALPPV